MTREEQIFEVAERHSEYEYNQTTYSNGFIDGARWADNNPNLHWISVKEKRPCDDKDMVIEFLKGIELRTKKVCVLLEDGFIDITYMYNFLPHGWHWNISDAITHWLPILEPPKE